MDRDFINACADRAVNNVSKCTKSILDLDGMSGNMTRHFYNNLLSLKKEDGSPLRYLEIGCWKGSSTLSALHGNNVLSTVIDNWSEFSGPRDEFHNNIAPYSNVQVIEENCFHPDIRAQLKHGPYDIYLYDGAHSALCHERGITHFWDALATTCIIIVDDWDFEEVREGTYRGFEKLNAQIAYKLEITLPRGRLGFWNGCGVFLIHK
jgi:hypothetical protein